MSDGTRRNTRIARSLDLVWAMKARGLSGRGKLVDVSLSGARLQLNHVQPVERGALLSLVCSQLPALPSSVTVMWTRKKDGHTICGVAFAQASPTWTKWMTEQLAAANTVARAAS